MWGLRQGLRDRAVIPHSNCLTIREVSWTPRTV